MEKAERERRHLANLQRINSVQVLAGVGDRTRIDHEETLLERVRMLEDEMAAHAATEAGLAALDKLLRTLEERSSRYGGDVALFVGALRDGKPLPLSALRGLDTASGDQAIAVLDAYRHARVDLIESVPGGARRVARALAPHLAARRTA